MLAKIKLDISPETLQTLIAAFGCIDVSYLINKPQRATASVTLEVYKKLQKKRIGQLGLHKKSIKLSLHNHEGYHLERYLRDFNAHYDNRRLQEVINSLNKQLA